MELNIMEFIKTIPHLSINDPESFGKVKKFYEKLMKRCSNLQAQCDEWRAHPELITIATLNILGGSDIDVYKLSLEKLEQLKIITAAYLKEAKFEAERVRDEAQWRLNNLLVRLEIIKELGGVSEYSKLAQIKEVTNTEIEEYRKIALIAEDLIKDLNSITPEHTSDL